MANPITVFNTDILTTISSVEYNGASGVNVDNENRIISLDENTLSAVSSVDNKLDISSYHEYSAGNNIDITNYEISGKDWTSDISNASSYAYNQATAQIPSEFDPTYMSGQIDNKLDKSDFDTYSGVVDNQITALRDDLGTVSTNTGYLYNDLTSTSAGLSGHIDYVSGSLTSKQDKLTEEQLSAISSISSLDTKFYPLNENPSGYLTTAETTDLMSASLLEISDNKITAYNGTAFAGQDDGPNADLSGVNIDISLDPTSSYIVLSAKDYTDDITAIGNDLSYVSGKVDSVSSELSGAVDYVSANIGDAFTGVNVNIPLTGDGKTSALGLMSYISWGGNGTTSTFTRSGVRVLDENNNSAYYLASGLNLNNESITDSAISSWNDTRTTVETNSANWGGITSVDTNHGISGNGTTSTPIGIASSFQLENPSVYTTATYKGDSIGIEGLFPRIQLKTDNSSYNTLGEGGMTITHSASGVGGGYTTSHYGSTMRLSYNDGDYYLHTIDTTKSGLGVAYKASPNVKAYYNYSGVALTNDNGATNEYVNVSSIRNWNDVYDTVSSNSASWTGGSEFTGVSTDTSLSGDGKNTPLGINSPIVQQNNESTASFNQYGLSINDGNSMEVIGVGDVRNWNNTYSSVSSNSATWNNSMSGLFLAKYGETSYDQVKSAVDANKIVYCITGGRCAFLAYSASNNYEFQYYRSVNGHTDTQQGDEVFVYKITKNSGSGTWSITERNAFSRVSAGVGLSSTYTTDKITLGIKDISSYATNTDLQYVSGQVDDKLTKSSADDLYQPIGNYLSANALDSVSGNWNDTYNTVNTNSGAWGGSALNISAGNGVKVELVDNTLVFSNDETVLWSGTASPSNFPLTMSEPFSAFEKIEFVWDTRYDGDYGTPTKGTIVYTDNHGSTVPTKYTLVEAYANASQTWWDWWYLENDNNGTTLSNLKAIYYPMTGGNSASQSNCRLFKVVGINRIAGGN